VGWLHGSEIHCLRLKYEAENGHIPAMHAAQMCFLVAQFDEVEPCRILVFSPYFRPRSRSRCTLSLYDSKYSCTSSTTYYTLIHQAFTMTQCYSWINNTIFRASSLYIPCGSPENQNVTCCVANTICYPNAICGYVESFPVGGSGFYGASCTDPTYTSPNCPQRCSKCAHVNFMVRTWLRISQSLQVYIQ
jgi:hypothetical protein